MARQGLPPLRLTVGGIDFTYEAEGVSYSNIDPGGHEMASFTLDSQRAALIFPGDPVVIQDGLQTVWQGRVAEPATTILKGLDNSGSKPHQTQSVKVSCEGSGAAFKDNLMSMVYIDRDLTRWTSISAQRQLNLSPTYNFQQFSWQIAADTATGKPALIISSPGQIIGTALEEIWYDSGPANLIGRIRVSGTAITYGFPDANQIFVVDTSPDDVASGGIATSGNIAAATFTVDLSPSILNRYALMQHIYNQTSTGAVGSAGFVYGYSLANISVMGNHGLPLRGSAPAADGFYTSDIAAHAASLALTAGARIKIGYIDTITGYIVPHYVQYDPVEHEQVIDDMAKLAPAHYGVWENRSIFEDAPEFTFRNYATDGSVYAAMADCNEIDLSERMSDLYTSAVVTYQNAAGTEFVINVSLPNYVLGKNSITRSTQIDIGLSSSTVAQAYASFVLQALFAQARSAGSIDLPKKIRDKNGALFPTHYLKAGIDRIRLADAPAHSLTFTGSDTDSFRISRVECTADNTTGEINTRAEVDTGPNLMETLQARFQITQSLIGV